MHIVKATKVLYKEISATSILGTNHIDVSWQKETKVYMCRCGVYCDALGPG